MVKACEPTATQGTEVLGGVENIGATAASGQVGAADDPRFTIARIQELPLNAEFSRALRADLDDQRLVAGALTCRADPHRATVRADERASTAHVAAVNRTRVDVG